MPGSDLPLVLIVDDDERNRRLAGDVLRVAGFRTLEAVRGAEAISLAFAHRPDVILMDLYLPDIDGTEAAGTIHSDPRTSDIPIVALSALAFAADDDWLSDAGFAGYLVKPIDVDLFPSLVRRFWAGDPG